MQDEVTYFRNSNDLDKIVEENPDYISVYFKKEIKNGKSTVKLSKKSGDELYLVSSFDHSNLVKYLSKKDHIKLPEKRSENQSQTISSEPAKKSKQQNLFNFFSKKKD